MARTGSVVLPVEYCRTRRRLAAGESSGSNRGYERLEIAMREVRTTPTNSSIVRTSVADGYSLSCHTYPAGVAQFAFSLWLVCHCGGGDLHRGLLAFIPNRIHHVAAWLGEQHTFFVGNPGPPGKHTVGSHVANTISFLRFLFPPDLAAREHPPPLLPSRVILASFLFTHVTCSLFELSFSPKITAKKSRVSSLIHKQNSCHRHRSSDNARFFTLPHSARLTRRSVRKAHSAAKPPCEGGRWPVSDGLPTILSGREPATARSGGPLLVPDKIDRHHRRF